MSTFISPRFKLNEENRLDAIIRRNISGNNLFNGQVDNSDDDTIDIDSIKRQQLSKDVSYTGAHNETTIGIYTAADLLLKSKLKGISFELIYKLADNHQNESVNELLPSGPLSPEDIYDIQITGVEDDAAYVVHNIDKEIVDNKIIINSGEKVIREDLFDRIISSPIYQQKFDNIQYLKVIKG